MKKAFLCCLLVLCVVAGGSAQAQTYQEVAGLVGLQLDHTVADICAPPLSSGSAWADYDNDDDVDLMVTSHGASNRLYQNQGDTDFDGLPDFVDVAVAAGVDEPTEVSISAVFIDYDNDGDQDLYVSNWGGNQLFENQLIETGSAVFTDVTATAGLADEGRAITTAWADFDNDGFLDVYLAKHRECGDNENSGDRLYRANGDGTFTNVTAWLCDGCDEIELSLSFAPAWLDYDNDGDLDLYVVNDAIAPMNSANQLWQNQGPDTLNPGQWKFENVTVAAGADIRLNGMGQGVGDIDNDGFLDIAMSNIGPNVLLHNQGDGTFVDIAETAGVDRGLVPDGSGISTTWGTVFFDYNNDGRLDLYIIAGNIADNPSPVQTNAMFRNDGNLVFSDVSDATGLNSSLRGRNVSTVDFDADGWIDVFDGNFAYTPALYHNDSAALGLQDNWLQITVEGTVDNRDAIGSRIWATTPAMVTQTREINTGPTHGGGDERVAHFGLRQAGRASVKVRWPNGAEQELGDFDANQRVHLVQELILGEVDPPTNTLEITGGDPGDDLVLAMGLASGSRPIPGCSGVTLGIANARRADTETADSIGVATLTSPAPQSLAGRTVLYQAYEVNSCRTSNIVQYTFPDTP